MVFDKEPHTASPSDESEHNAADLSPPEPVRKEKIAPFVVKVYEMVNDSQEGLVRWAEDKESFVVEDPVIVGERVLPRYFKSNNFCSFVRQLNTYGFSKVGQEGQRGLVFKNPHFRQQKPDLAAIKRRKSGKKRKAESMESEHSGEESVEAAPASTPIKVEDGEVDRLRRSNETLMQQLLLLHQQHAATQQILLRTQEELRASREAQTQLALSVQRLSELVLHPHPQHQHQQYPHPVSAPSPAQALPSPLSAWDDLPHPAPYDRTDMDFLLREFLPQNM